ncbi:MAG: DUF4197 domain-containing protein [Bacteroidetes bacterium]|nr:MAG: DUF4197 domain-containing protein [Bacteroidota bacterium]TNE99095.1 MAG: DUF4197 domain-containing protein [Bacteroidota bacterium]
MNIKSRILIIFSAITVFSCDVLNDAAEILTTDPGTSTPALTNAEVISGLKEALNVGIKNSVDITSVTDGFLGNPEIRLPFPEDAIKVKQKALDWGLDGQVEKFETTLNRAAEEACKEALPIFKDAILKMSISDGFAILNGGNGAATKYLKDNTTTALKQAFRPKVDAAISTVKLTDYWEPIITKYNSAMTFTGGEKLNPDLNEYVTDKAIIGLFHMVEKEENKIRLDPMARVSDILQKVFGSLDK